MAQAILLPLEMGLSLQQTATIIGRSISTTSTCRNKFLRSTQERTSLFGKKRFMRNRAYLSFDDEAQMLNDLLEWSAHGEVLLYHHSEKKLNNGWGKKWLCLPYIACWPDMDGVNWLLIQRTRKAMPLCAKTGKKLPGRVEEIVLA